jgi:hypothetical protein
MKWIKASERLGEFQDSDIPEWKFWHPQFCKIDGQAAEKPFFRKDIETGVIVFCYIYTGNFSRQLPESEFHLIEWLDESPITTVAPPVSEEGGKLVLWDGIDGSMEDIDSLEHAKKWLKENYYDSEEGFHPDIELCKVYQEAGIVSLIPGSKPNTVRLEVNPITKTSSITQPGFIEKHKEVLNQILNALPAEDVYDYDPGDVVMKVQSIASKALAAAEILGGKGEEGK